MVRNCTDVREHGRANGIRVDERERRESLSSKFALAALHQIEDHGVYESPALWP